jgi:hypothetical protein
MTVASVQALASRMDETAAVAALNGPGWLASLRGEKLSRVALVLVPFWTFEVTVEAVSFRDRYRVAFDAIAGSLDPYRTRADVPLPLHSSDGPNCLAPRLSEAAVHERAIEFARREVYLKGFGRIRDLTIAAGHRADADFHVPYWLGFYEAGRDIAVKVINAHSGKREGRKAVELFHHWLTRK